MITCTPSIHRSWIKSSYSIHGQYYRFGNFRSAGDEYHRIEIGHVRCEKNDKIDLLQLLPFNLLPSSRRRHGKTFSLGQLPFNIIQSYLSAVFPKYNFQIQRLWVGASMVFHHSLRLLRCVSVCARTDFFFSCVFHFVACLITQSKAI